MDITKGSLDDISRPASSERSRAGSRLSTVFRFEMGRVSQVRPGSLEVLSTDISETQDQWKEKENNLDFSSGNLSSDQDGSDEENENPELQKAIKKMKMLDRILALRISKEKEVKKQGRELYLKIWQDLEDLKLKRTPEGSDEAENTRLFLALTSNNSKNCTKEEDFVPVFGTQVPEEESDLSFNLKNEEVRELTESSGSVDGGQEVRRDKQTDGRPTMSKSKHRQDFVKKNIELAGGAGSLVLMTQEEKERLEELLKDLEEEEAHGDLLTKAKTDCSLSTVPLTSGEGYAPQPAELDQLLHIDARLQLLLPFENFLSVKSHYTDRSLTQCGLHGSDGERTAERPPGEMVLLDMKESRGQEERLREIQQQLQLLGCSQQTTSLPEEHLRSLLMECEVALSRCSDSKGTEESFPRTHCALVTTDAMSLLASTPSLSSSALSELLHDSCGIPNNLHESVVPGQQEESSNLILSS